MKFMVTGGAGFIGSAVIRFLIGSLGHSVINIDKLTYASNLRSLASIENDERYSFEKIDICDRGAVQKVIYEHRPDIILHLAAESHVDRSIDGPEDFIHTNIFGTFTLLDVAKDYWYELSGDKKQKFRFHHVSTDEVFGDLEPADDPFSETSPYAPSSPYSASKAGSDHLVRAWSTTYGLPIVVTNCSNNYGPCQNQEKLIPLMIVNALKGRPMPVYGLGTQIRDWLYVDDHAEALVRVALEGQSGQTYNIGGNNEKTNLEVVHTICEILDELMPIKVGEVTTYRELVKFVEDRPGHDVRYAINTAKIFNNIGWFPSETFETGIRKTVIWYLENNDWYEDAVSNDTYQQRLGLGV